MISVHSPETVSTVESVNQVVLGEALGGESGDLRSFHAPKWMLRCGGSMCRPRSSCGRIEEFEVRSRSWKERK